MEDEYDIVVIGSGIAGSTLGLCLAQGKGERENDKLLKPPRVLVVEHKTHPRFVIGESTIVITTFNFNYLGKTYGIPELDGLSTYWCLRQSGVTCFPKCHFWYGCHQEREELKKEHQLMAETFAPPQGPDVHFVRSDLDAYLVSLFPKYGVEYMDRTSITSLENNKEGVNLELLTRTGEEENNNSSAFQHNEPLSEHGMARIPKAQGEIIRRIKAKYIVDASGHAAFLSRKFNYLQKEPQLQTRTRTIYGHFKYAEGWNLDNFCGTPGPHFKYSRHAGTQHHFFPGGWMWVIPFDNNTVSVGLVLNIDRYPYNYEMKKEEEFWQIVKRYPTIHNHLSPLEQCMPFVRTGRIQMRSNSILGERFILTPHASGFIDPLFSSGIALTTTFIVRFIPEFNKALRDNDFSTERFQWLESYFFKELDFVDKMVSGTILSSVHPELFKQYMRVWFEAAARAHLDMFIYNANKWPIFGSHDSSFSLSVDKAWLMVKDHFESGGDGADDSISVARCVKEVLDPVAVGCKLAAYEFPVLSDSPINGQRLRHPSLMRAVLLRKPIELIKLLFVFLWFVFFYYASFFKLTRYPYYQYWDRSFSFMAEHERRRFRFLPRIPKRIETADIPKDKWGIIKFAYLPEIANQQTKKDV